MVFLSYLLQFEPEMFPKGSLLRAWLPADGLLGVILSGGLCPHQWVIPLMGCIIGRWTLVGRSRSMGVCPLEGYKMEGVCPRFLALSASWLPRGEKLSFAMPFYHDALFHHWLRDMEPSDHGLKSLELSQNESFQVDFVRNFVTQVRILTNTPFLF
jgi:hypothetical protein